MQNKNHLIIGGVGLLFIGILVGFCVGGNNGPYSMNRGFGMHRMSDNRGMYNVSMDMDDMMQGMMYSLKDKKGEDFDKEFLTQMTIHHQGAVQMAKAVLTSSQNPELIKLANDIISAQDKEITMMQGWQKAWFK